MIHQPGGQRSGLFTVVAGDVVQSRGIANREAFQDRLQDALEHAAKARDEYVVAQPKIMMGDGFEAVFSWSLAGFQFAEAVADAVAPIRIRVGIGFGPISTRVHKDDVGRMDGVAFQHARAALQSPQNHWIRVEPNQGFEMVANDVLVHAGRIRNGWTRLGWQVLRTALQRRTIAEDARRLGLSKQRYLVRFESLDYCRYEELVSVASTLLLTSDGPPRPFDPMGCWRYKGGVPLRNTRRPRVERR